MSEAKTSETRPAALLGLQDEDLVQEFGYDEDVDFDLREDIADLTGNELLDEEDQEVVDAVLLWWREGDGDLIDALVDSLATLDEKGVVWLLCPKAGRGGHVSPSEVQTSANTAGLKVTTSAQASDDWSATRLVTTKF